MFFVFVLAAIWYVAIREVPGTGQTILQLLSAGWKLGDIQQMRP